MKTLIAGFGSIGRRHLNNLRSLGETDFVLLRSFHSTLPEDDIKGIPVERDIKSALAHRPDAVIITNPTSLHLDVAIPAAKAGCSILIEKPVSHNMERISDLQRALEQGGGRLLVGFQFRYHPALRQVKGWLDSNQIGTVISCRARWGEYLPGWHPWEDYRKSYSARVDLGGGVVNTLSHPLDYLRWFFGDVDNLWAFASSLGGLELDVEDTAEIILHFKNNVLGSIHLDYIQRPPEHTLKIIGSKGTIEWDNATGVARRYQIENSTWEVANPPAGFERNHLFLEEMKHFLAVVNERRAPICGLADGIAAVELAEAIHRTADQSSQKRTNTELELE
ncbi:MAG: Gfo/Idh/MocA family oxidoreductase [Chloroflexi bacterium]|nr:Gfo/Idh/MocA family oxidoreductase [Chloroflexota bacterium]